MRRSFYFYFPVFALVLALLGVPDVLAQTLDNSARVIPIPTERPAEDDTASQSFIPLPTGTDVFPDEEASLNLKASIGSTEAAIADGFVWRIYGDKVGDDGKLPLLATASGGSTNFKLKAGYYLVHASFGYAGLTKRIKVLPPQTDSSFTLDAGGLRLNAAFREGDIIPSRFLTFEISSLDGNNTKPIVKDIKADELVKLASGTYQVTSHYGDLNSQVSAEVRVKPGKLTELTLYQRGAEITLKLVSEIGGEALANTSWTVLTPGGDPVINTIASAFPTLILAAGEYLAYARHEGKTYSTRFAIESGVHRDVELVLGQQE